MNNNEEFSQKDKLISLLYSVAGNYELDLRGKLTEIANWLVLKNVIALPCKLGDTVYFVDEMNFEKAVVVGFIYREQGLYIRAEWDSTGNAGMFKPHELCYSEYEARKKEMDIANGVR